MQGKDLAQAISELEKESKSKEDVEVLAPQKVIPGNRPSNTLYFDKSTPRAIGALIALYEHKVFVQGQIWGINSFDQWGVELGKQLGDKVHGVLLAEEDSQGCNFDSSTQGLISAFRNMKSKL